MEWLDAAAVKVDRAPVRALFGSKGRRSLCASTNVEVPRRIDERVHVSVSAGPAAHVDGHVHESRKFASGESPCR